MKTPANALRNVLWFPLTTAVVICLDETLVNQKTHWLILTEGTCITDKALYHYVVCEYGLISDTKQNNENGL